MRQGIFILAFLFQFIFSAAFYAVGFHAGADNSARLLNAGSTFTDVPTTEQVADIYTRLSGLAPLLWEDEVNLPSAENVASQPLLLEVSNGVIPSTVTTVVATGSFDTTAAPSVDDVVSYLKTNGVHCEGKKIESHELSAYLERSQPVVVLQRGESGARFLATTTSNSTNTIPISEFEIAQYQICLWTAVIFVLLGLGSICAMANMEVVPDNLLYAKFQSGRTEKRD